MALRRLTVLARWLALAAVVAGLAGCAAEGTSNDDVEFREDGVPFTFEHPAELTDEEVDQANSRGDVVAVRALDKVNVLAVRRLPAGARRSETALRVLGKDVTSIVTPVARAPGWGLECQYTADRREALLDACREARDTIRIR